MGKPITIDEDLLWNTLHPDGMGNLLTAFGSFLEEYYEDTSHRVDAAILCGRLHQISDQLWDLKIDDYDWKTFRRSYQLTKQGER